MKILLTSNGLTNSELKEAFLDLTGNRKGLRIGIIPTASDPIEWIPDKEDKNKFTAKIVEERLENNRKWLDEYSKKFINEGHTVVIVDLKSDPDEVKEKLYGVDVIDVTGGDVNYLLNWAKKAKVDLYLKDLLDKGVVYVGSSAGTGLVTPDIGLGWWEPGDSEDHIGFGIVDFVMVVHQEEEDERSNTSNVIKRRDYLRSIINFPWKIYLVKDGQAIKVDGDKVQHIGPGVKKSV